MKFYALVFFLVLFPTAAFAQSSAQTGVGAVSFPNSGSPSAQPEFLLGLAQLHNFEYEDAAKHFRAAQKLDPGFAMAYWGEAMTHNHGIWHEQNLRAAREALGRLAATPEARQAKAPTSREKQYLGAIEILYGEGAKDDRDQLYVAAMSQLHRNIPDDVDATAFYALAILSSAEHGRDFATYMRAAALLEEVFPAHSHHPGVVHYLIHSYDDPIHAPLGLRAARIYSAVAPEAGHAQHMTSHIFLAMGMWDDVVKANEIAVSVVNRQRAADGEEPRYCGHYPYWLQYGYLQQGRINDARRVLENCRDEARRQSERRAGNPNAHSDMSSVGAYAMMRANFLVDSKLWKETEAFPSFSGTRSPFTRMAFDYADAFAAFKLGNLAAAKESLAQMDQVLAEMKSHLEQNRAVQNQSDDVNDYSGQTILADQIRALLSWATLANSAASADAAAAPNPKARVASETITTLKSLAEKERALPMEFGPPVIFKPTYELLGELYLESNRPSDAALAFQSALARAPNRRLAQLEVPPSERQSF